MHQWAPLPRSRFPNPYAYPLLHRHFPAGKFLVLPLPYLGCPGFTPAASGFLTVPRRWQAQAETGRAALRFSFALRTVGNHPAYWSPKTPHLITSGALRKELASLWRRYKIPSSPNTEFPSHKTPPEQPYIGLHFDSASVSQILVCRNALTGCAKIHEFADCSC